MKLYEKKESKMFTVSKVFLEDRFLTMFESNEYKLLYMNVHGLCLMILDS